MVAWTFFPAGTIHFMHGTPRVVRHANRVRTFCQECGTPLTFYDPAIPAEFEVTTCSLDDARIAPPPADHNWIGDSMPWLHANEDLPAFEHNAPLTPNTTILPIRP